MLTTLSRQRMLQKPCIQPPLDSMPGFTVAPPPPRMGTFTADHLLQKMRILPYALLGGTTIGLQGEHACSLYVLPPRLPFHRRCHHCVRHLSQCRRRAPLSRSVASPTRNSPLLSCLRTYLLCVPFKSLLPNTHGCDPSSPFRVHRIIATRLALGPSNSALPFFPLQHNTEEPDPV